jgi:hypothetical protein
MTIVLGASAIAIVAKVSLKDMGVAATVTRMMKVEVSAIRVMVSAGVKAPMSGDCG